MSIMKKLLILQISSKLVMTNPLGINPIHRERKPIF